MSDNDHCRTPTAADLIQLIQSLNKENVSYFLIGGHALHAHGYYRMTTDIDLLLPKTVDSEAVIRALLVLPDRIARDIDPAWFVEGNTIRLADEFMVDLMFNACGESYESLSQHACTTYLDEVPVKTIDMEGLLKTKQTFREKDKIDRMLLERVLAEQKLEQEKSEREKPANKSSPGPGF